MRVCFECLEMVSFGLFGLAVCFGASIWMDVGVVWRWRWLGHTCVLQYYIML